MTLRDELRERLDARAQHLQRRDPRRWREMTPLERTAYNAGWLDATARLVPEVSKAEDEV